MENYSNNYSDESFWSKMVMFLKKASKDLLFKALVLYYTADLPETPAWAKGIIYGALGYFILPVDLIPDYLPGGLVDDMTVLGAAIATVALYVTPESENKAKEKIDSWFASETVISG